MRKPDSLTELHTRLKRYWDKAHSQMRIADGLYERQPVFQMLLPDEIPIHIPSTASNIVDNMKDQIRTDEPTVIVQAATETQREQATRLQQWALDRLTYIRNWTEVDAFEQAKADCLLRGACCIKLLIDETALPEPPEPNSPGFEAAMADFKAKKLAAEPFIVRPIDPLTVYPAPGNKYPLRYILERQKRTVADMEEFEQWTDPQAAKGKVQANDPLREVEWLEYWSSDYYIVEVDGDRIIDEPNPYGFVPYIYDFSGLGRTHADGDPVHLARGLLSSIQGELEAEIRLKTAWDAQWQFHVFPVLLVKDNARLARRQLQVGPGRIAEWGQLGDEKPEWLTVPPPQPAMIEFLNRIEAAISRQSAPVLQGRMQGSSQYGILEALRIGQAMKVVSPVIRTLNRVGARVLTTMARMAWQRGLDFRVASTRNRQVVLSSDAFANANIRVDFKAVDAAENDRKLLVGESLTAHQLLSRRTFHEKYAATIVDDPEAEERRLIVEQIVKQLVDSGAMTQAVMAGLNPAAQAEAVLGQAASAATRAPMEMTSEALAGQPQLAAARSNTGQATMSEQLGSANGG